MISEPAADVAVHLDKQPVSAFAQRTVVHRDDGRRSQVYTLSVFSSDNTSFVSHAAASAAIPEMVEQAMYEVAIDRQREVNDQRYWPTISILGMSHNIVADSAISPPRNWRASVVITYALH